MNLDLDTILTALAGLRSTLEELGITNQMLLLAGGVSLVISFLSLREVLGWFLKTHHLQNEIHMLRQEVHQLRLILDKTHTRLLDQPENDILKASTPKPNSAEAHTFRLDH